MNQSVFRIHRQFILPACFAISLPAFAPAQDKADEKNSSLTDQERAEAIKYFEETRRGFLDAIKGLSHAHPVFKDLDAYQWLIFTSGHSARHTAQINEVKEAPEYPKK
jgi:DinB superfamily